MKFSSRGQMWPVFVILISLTAGCIGDGDETWTLHAFTASWYREGNETLKIEFTGPYEIDDINGQPVLAYKINSTTGTTSGQTYIDGAFREISVKSPCYPECPLGAHAWLGRGMPNEFGIGFPLNLEAGKHVTLLEGGRTINGDWNVGRDYGRLKFTDEGEPPYRWHRSFEGPTYHYALGELLPTVANEGQIWVVRDYSVLGPLPEIPEITPVSTTTSRGWQSEMFPGDEDPVYDGANYSAADVLRAVRNQLGLGEHWSSAACPVEFYIIPGLYPEFSSYLELYDTIGDHIQVTIVTNGLETTYRVSVSRDKILGAYQFDAGMTRSESARASCASVLSSGWPEATVDEMRQLARTMDLPPENPDFGASIRPGYFSELPAEKGWLMYRMSFWDGGDDQRFYFEPHMLVWSSPSMEAVTAVVRQGF